MFSVKHYLKFQSFFMYSILFIIGCIIFHAINTISYINEWYMICIFGFFGIMGMLVGSFGNNLLPKLKIAFPKIAWEFRIQILCIFSLVLFIFMLRDGSKPGLLYGEILILVACALLLLLELFPVLKVNVYYRMIFNIVAALSFVGFFSVFQKFDWEITSELLLNVISYTGMTIFAIAFAMSPYMRDELKEKRDAQAVFFNFFMLIAAMLIVLSSGVDLVLELKKSVFNWKTIITLVTFFVLNTYFGIVYFIHLRKISKEQGKW